MICRTIVDLTRSRIAWSVLLLVSSVATISSSHAQDLQPNKQVLFDAGDGGIHLYRIPGIVVTPKGTILAYCEARKNAKKDWGEIEVHLRRSIDGGKTWEPSRRIAHEGTRIEGTPSTKNGPKEQTVNNPVAIIDPKTGAIEFLYCVNYARCFSMRSVDDGVTFSQPVEITSCFEKFRERYDWNVIATGPGHGIALPSGRLVVPIWLAYGKPGDHAPSATATIYSDDHGKSWHAGEIAVPNQGDYHDPNETMIALRSNREVMLITRSVSKPNRKIITTSSTGIDSWSKPRFQSDLWEPICMASILALPNEPGSMLFSNPRTLGLDKEGKEVPAGRGKRENLTMHLSRDDGETWPIHKTLESGPSAYSDLAQLPNGKILCLYEGKDRIHLATFDLAWLTQP